MKRKIFITANGDALSLYDEKINKFADMLGHKQIHRASTVEFNNSTNKWEVRMPPSCPNGIICGTSTDASTWELMAEAETREEALTKEKQLVETLYREQLRNGAQRNS